MYRLLFRFVKNKIPRISETEMIALRSGNTSIDREILQGKINMPTKVTYPNKFPQNELNRLFSEFDGSRVYPNDNDNYWIIDQSMSW